VNKKAAFLAFVALLTALLLPGIVLAQSGLDSSQDPNYGTYELELYPDPLITTMLSGGDVDVGSFGLGDGCTGNATSNPDFKVDVSGSVNNLRAFFMTDQGDTTLIVELPDGSYVCNDDFSDLNPLVDIPNAGAGIYSIWVGTLGSSDFLPGYLVVTSGTSMPGALVSNLLGSATGTSTTATTTTTTTTSSDALNPGGQPTYGTSTLSAGFVPDPTEVSVSAGGPVDVRAQNLGDGCLGFAASNPDYRIEWSGSAPLLRIFFVSDDDTTLIVGTPSGEFVCNDDFNGLDPLVDIPNPSAGTYNIWVGSFGSDEIVPGTLSITGSSSDPTK
jgi:serine protease Do